VRVVVDPNVLVSAVVATGVSAELVDRWLTERPFEIVTCPSLIDELRDVLGRDKFRRWVTVAEAQLFIDRLETEAESWADPTAVPPVTSDPKDDYLVALFRACRPTCSSRATETCSMSRRPMSPCPRPPPSSSASDRPPAIDRRRGVS
jgi:predicted nucleic acid-binding protein